ncbi:MAG: protein translocase subunit SecD [Verrucomicrobia bacterium]|nr:protein translocase subunit SecD [Verrucomicrobiota bacterium]NBU07809.1 protein translocase subunit SecD [Pseudomonadota bacterium]NDA65027.1 protein translocase subunit SecD [Verrucomicrobiota bacterium]NDB74046.1 protein translocase subunit SecD [Verrucomicrobiota bacterium]NDD36935.1 protein translocase subunit SecD [Verrucomicrobiota bacterium]
MQRNNTWRALLVLFITVWAFFEIYPPTNRNIIDVLEEQATQKGTNFNAIITKARALDKEFPERNFANLRDAIGTNSLTNFVSYSVSGEKDPNRAIMNRLQRVASGKIKLGLDLRGGTSFLVGLDTSKLDATADKKSLVAQAIEVLRKRVDKFGVAEPIIVAEGEDRIVIQMPGLDQAARDQVKEALTKPANLEFRLVHPDSDRMTRDGLMAPGHEVLTQRRKGQDGREYLDRVLVKNKAEGGLTGKYIKSASVIRDNVSNRPQISFEFNSEGGKIFGDLTTKHTRERMAIVLDGELYSAPVINEPILGGRGVINGDFDLKEAWQLANVLENPLETPVRLLDTEEVDPSLGKDAIDSGLHSAIFGTLAVAVFMLIYYRKSGFVADVALIFNSIILLGVMCSIGTTFTLPGIAGIVLTIGMAVDANVLIYERIREELAKGKSVRGAIAAGYDRAFGTIFDSHVTTLISSVILIYLGTGTVKGFGVALTIGVALSLFTALVITRLIFDWMLTRGLADLSMMHLIKATNIDFMQLAKPAFIASWTIIIIGCCWGGFVRGKQVFGPDFVGGDALVFNFEKKVETDKLREAVAKVEYDYKDKAAKNAAVQKRKVGDPLIQYQKNLAAKSESLRVTVPEQSAEAVKTAMVKAFPEAKFELKQSRQVGAVIGQEIMTTAIWAILLSLFGILIYVAVRYEFSFAVGAVLAVLHDVLMTIGIYCLTSLWSEGRQFNATSVAAILTIIGFSINDTIVIFDRIREDLKLGVRGTFRELMNQALNQTLSRTIITSGTVFIATFVLYVFGGGVINDFAFMFLVGVITGTYSSIYIASALVLWWNKGQRPDIGTVSQVAVDGAQHAAASRTA